MPTHQPQTGVNEILIDNGGNTLLKDEQALSYKETPTFESDSIKILIDSNGNVLLRNGQLVICGEQPTPTPTPIPPSNGLFLAYTYQSTPSWWYSTNGTTYQTCPNLDITTGANGSYNVAKINDKIIYITTKDATSESLFIYPYHIDILNSTATKLNGIAVESISPLLSLMNVGGVLYLIISYESTYKTEILVSTNEGVSWTKIYTTITDKIIFYPADGSGNFIRTKTGTYFYGYNRNTSKGHRIYISTDYSTIIEDSDSSDGSISPPIMNNDYMFYMNGRYYVKCFNYIYITSEEDDFVWEKHEFVISDLQTNGGRICSNYNNIAVYMNASDATRKIWYSYDALNWIPVSSVPGSGGYDGYVTYGDGKFSVVYYCAGSGAKSTSNSVYSLDGITWYEATTPNNTNYISNLGYF